MEFELLPDSDFFRSNSFNVKNEFIYPDYYF